MENFKDYCDWLYKECLISPFPRVDKEVIKKMA